MTNDKAALITGASSGIGKAIAWRLARVGIRVLVGYSSGEERARKVCDEIRGKYDADAIPVPIKLDYPHLIGSRFHAIAEKHGPIGYLVNNAGVNDRSSGFSLDAKKFGAILSINLMAPLLLASAAGKYFAVNEIKGSIVNITSVHDTIPISGGALYCASKGGLSVASKALALEFAHYGIRVNTVAPGETATPMNGISDTNRSSVILRSAIPSGRAGEPTEIANAVAWLLSPEAEYVVGETIYVDGGLMLMAAEENAKASPKGKPPEK